MKKFFGALLLGAGILIAGLSGLCGALAIASFFFDSSSETGGMVPVVVMLTLVPLAIGVGLIFGGRALIRSGYEDDRRDMER